MGSEKIKSRILSCKIRKQNTTKRKIQYAYALEKGNF